MSNLRPTAGNVGLWKNESQSFEDSSCCGCAKALDWGSWVSAVRVRFWIYPSPNRPSYRTEESLSAFSIPSASTSVLVLSLST